MNIHKLEEETFFIVFEDLIKAFTDNMDKRITSDEKEGFSKKFIEGFEGTPLQQSVVECETASTEEIHLNTRRLDMKFEKFMSTLEDTTFNHFIIPYDQITKCVFENTPEEDLHEFTKDLHKRGEKYFLTQQDTQVVITEEIVANNEQHILLSPEKMYFKILRHINLALVQKYTLMRLQIKALEELKRDQQTLINRYDELKKEAETQNRNMLSQFITILGIFTAIIAAFFSGVSLSNSLINSGVFDSVETTITVGSIVAIFILTLIFMLLTWVDHILNKNVLKVKHTEVYFTTLIALSAFAIIGIILLVMR